MEKQKSKAIIFGAGEGGKSFVKFQSEYEIAAIVDNDINKHGSNIDGIPIVHPEAIKDLDYDFVIITSIYIYQIREQLISQLKVSPEKVILPLKSQMKPSFHPFEDEYTLEYARRTLLFLAEIFDKNDICYFTDFGTLLGIVRDRDLIPWDDDIDISVYQQDVDKVIESIRKNIALLGKQEQVKWNACITYDSDNKPNSIDLSFNHGEEESIKSFQVNIGIIYFVDDLAVQMMNHSPKYHFEKRDHIAYKGKTLSVPFDYESYLEYTYGNWRQPRKDTSFGDNTLTYREPSLAQKKTLI